MPSPRSKNSQIYVTGYSQRTSEDDLEDAFRKFGKIRDIVMKSRYAFIEFNDNSDAEEAVNEMDGRSLDGHKIVVQTAGAKPSRKSRGPQADDKCYKCGKTGHWANECREEVVKSSEKREKRCYHCQGIGHIKKYCPLIGSESERSRNRSSRSRSSSSSRSKSKSRSRSSPKRKHKRKHSSSSRSASRSKSKSRSKNHKKSHKKSRKRSPSSSQSRSRSKSRSRSPSDSRSARSGSKDKVKKDRKPDGSPDQDKNGSQ